jgi:hypothetical protein
MNDCRGGHDFVFHAINNSVAVDKPLADTLTANRMEGLLLTRFTTRFLDVFDDA